jgi:hypothetical protein
MFLEAGAMTEESAQEAKALARRKVIYELKHPETKHGGDRKSDQVENSSTRSDTFADATAKATGKTSRTIRTAVSRAKAIPDIEKTIGFSGDDLRGIPAPPKGRCRPREVTWFRKPPEVAGFHLWPNPTFRSRFVGIRPFAAILDRLRPIRRAMLAVVLKYPYHDRYFAPRSQ